MGAIVEVERRDHAVHDVAAGAGVGDDHLGSAAGVLAVDQIDQVQRVPGVPERTRPASPTPWSESMFSHVAPRRRPKYLAFGWAWMLRAGTTNHIPSIAATRPPPHRRARSMPSCAVTRAAAPADRPWPASPPTGGADRRGSAGWGSRRSSQRAAARQCRRARRSRRSGFAPSLATRHQARRSARATVRQGPQASPARSARGPSRPATPAR